MASLTSERARRGRAALVLALAIVSAWAASPGRAETRYVYQTRYTAFSPLAARFRHVTLMLGAGNIGVFGGSGRMDAELFDPATEQSLTLPVSYWLADFSGVTLADGRAEKWCVEYCDGDIRQSTVWLDGYACPAYRDTAFPHPAFHRHSAGERRSHLHASGRTLLQACSL